MSEPRSDDLAADADPPRAPDTTVEPTSDPAREPAPADWLTRPQGPFTDETPTIISKKPPQPMANGDGLTAGLRGRRLAHFELLEPIGVGGMAAVMRARDTQLDRVVALKILPPESAADPENVRRFHNEARSAAKLDHENIARVFFCGDDQGLHFIAFEYVEGENLRALAERSGRLPVPEAVHYLLQVATGLAHAATRGVVHRDIKPSNIIISPNGRAKLVDMGLARSLEPQADQGLTQSGVTLGTFDYISPEQALEPREADVRSDIYSLGCTFYHVMTGQAPVPEGTAARKLHHHQHVLPADPRQLNPAIPDEVAAILARMMAKDPRARFQRCEQLVQNVLLVARKLGTPDTGPDGVLFVDAALPEPPRRGRPLVAAALAVAAVVGLALAAGQAGRSSRSDPNALLRPGPAADPEGGAVGSAPVATLKPSEGGEGPAAVVRTQPTPQPVYDADPPNGRDLVEFVRKNRDARSLEIVLAGDVTIDLAALGGDFDSEPVPALVVRAKNLTLRAKANGKRPLIRFSYDSWIQPRRPSWAAPLIIEGDRAAIQGVSFLVDARSAEVAMAAVCLRGGVDASITDCAFFQAQVPQAEGRLSSVVVGQNPGAARRPTLRLRDCYFGYGEESRPASTAAGVSAGQEAVTLAGPANVDVADCAFGPHATLFRVEPATERSRISLRSCAALAGDRWTAFSLDEGASCEPLEIRHCLFSRPEPEAGGSAVLIRKKGSGNLRVDGQDNGYHDLDGYYQAPGEETPADWASYQARAREAGWKDDSRLLGTSPWKRDNPLAILAGGLSDDGALRNAFLVKDDLPDLRQSDYVATRLIGPSHCVWGPCYTTPLPKLDSATPTAVAKKERIVDPKVAMSSNGVYASLGAALEDARPGDVVLIRHTGVLRINPAQLVKGDTDVTIRPFTGYQPVLTLGETPDSDAALFTVYDGQLTLEGLELLLRPVNPKLAALCAVRMVGDGSCVLKNCVVTLQDARRVPLCVATVASDPGAGMREKIEPKAARTADQPRLRMQDCFLRGEGDGVLARVSRPFQLDVTNCLAALSGSFLNIDASREETVPPPGQEISVRLTRLTAYLGGHLVHLHAGKDMKTLVPVNCAAVVDCLFASATGRVTLVHLDGPETSDEKMKTQVVWSGSRNTYSNYPAMLDQQQTDSEMSMPLAKFTQEKWKTFTGENDAAFTRVRFTDPPLVESLGRAVPGNFKLLQSEGPRSGADVGLLPKPAPEEGSSVPR